MTKTTYNLVANYIYDAQRKGAKYSFDGGQHWCNGGDAHEIHLKACLGLKPEKDANTPYDKGSDIPKYCASVKSARSTLVNSILGNTYNEVKATYFKNVHSTSFVWAVIIDDTISAYWMNKTEFNEFMDKFSFFDDDRKVIRFKISSGKMLQWLEARV